MSAWLQSGWLTTAAKHKCAVDKQSMALQQHLLCTSGVMSLESCRCTRVSAIAYLRKLATSSGPCARQSSRGFAAGKF